MESVYCHFTERENLKSCMLSGLAPQIGERAGAVGEPHPRIYLCRKEDAAAWHLQLPLKNPCLLEVSVPKNIIHIKERNIYGKDMQHGEYVCETPIPACYLKEVPLPKLPGPGMCHRLISEAMVSLSFEIVKIVRIFDHYPVTDKAVQAEIEKYMLYYWKYSVWYLNRLAGAGAFEHQDVGLLKQEMIRLGDSGEYTMADYYDGNGWRMFEQVGRFDGPFLETRKALAGCVREYFPWVGKLPAGGYENTARSGQKQQNAL